MKFRYPSWLLIEMKLWEKRTEGEVKGRKGRKGEEERRKGVFCNFMYA
jgi:hypothetical protein